MRKRFEKIDKNSDGLLSKEEMIEANRNLIDKLFLKFDKNGDKKYINILGFIILGFYLASLDNRAAMLFWITSLIIALTYFTLNLLKKYNLVRKIIPFIFSNKTIIHEVKSFVFFWFKMYFFYFINWMI